MDHLFKVTFKHSCSQKDMYLQLIGQDISEIHPYLSRYYKHATSIKITDLGHYNVLKTVNCINSYRNQRWIFWF